MEALLSSINWVSVLYWYLGFSYILGIGITGFYLYLCSSLISNDPEEEEIVSLRNVKVIEWVMVIWIWAFSPIIVILGIILGCYYYLYLKRSWYCNFVHLIFEIRQQFTVLGLFAFSLNNIYPRLRSLGYFVCGDLGMGGALYEDRFSWNFFGGMRLYDNMCWE